MATEKPMKPEDRAELNAKNKAFTEQLERERQKAYHMLSDIDFKNSLIQKTEEELQQILLQMKGERQFYRKIMQEKYYNDHPEKIKTHRYEDASFKYNSINTKGKIVLELIYSKQ